MNSHPAGELHDENLSQEIELLGDLVLAASRVARHLTPDEIDQILEPPQPTPPPPRGASRGSAGRP